MGDWRRGPLEEFFRGEPAEPVARAFTGFGMRT